jgi:RHS repeat-associated protein
MKRATKAARMISPQVDVPGVLNGNAISAASLPLPTKSIVAKGLIMALIHSLLLQPLLFYPTSAQAQVIDAGDLGSGNGSCDAPPKNPDPTNPNPDPASPDPDPEPTNTNDPEPGPVDSGDPLDGGSGGGVSGGTDGHEPGSDMGGGSGSIDVGNPGFGSNDPHSLNLDNDSGADSLGDGRHAPIVESVPARRLYITDSGINLAAADKQHTQVDYVSQGAAPLRVARSYHSNAAANPAWVTMPIGAGWHGYYDRYLAGYSGTQMGLHRPNGQIVMFNLVGGAWVTNVPAGMLSYNGSVWQYINNRNETENYNPINGRLLSITKAGLTTTLQYDANLRLIKVVNPFGRTLSYTWDVNYGRISTITLPDGNTIGYGYDARNNLVSTRFADNSVRQYVYENASFPNAMTGVIDEAGRRRLTWSYDASGRPNMGTYGSGVNTVNVTYSGSNATVTDAKGTQRTRYFGFAAGQTLITGLQTSATATTAGTIWYFAYDANGNPSSITTRSGEVRSITADSRGRVTSATRATGTSLALNKVSQWHPTYRLPVQASGLGVQRNWTIDAAGRVTQVTQTGSGVTATLMSKTYNAQGLLQTVTDARGATFTFAYDAAGNRTSVTNALNNTTYYQNFNAHGQATRIQKADGTIITRVFDLRGRMTSETIAGLTTTYTYDASNRVTRVTQPDGSWSNLAFDTAGNVNAITNQRGERIALTRDVTGNVTNTSVYNSAGTLVKAKTQEYNAVSRLAASVDTRGYRKQFLYSADGRPSGVTDPLAQTKNYQLDGLSRLTAVTNQSTRYTRESVGGTLTVNEITGYDIAKAAINKKVDNNNIQTNYALDYFNRKSSETNVDGGSKSAALNAAGDVTTFTDAKGVTFTRSQDASGRLTAITPPAGYTPLSFSYIAGRNDALLASMSDPSGTTSWTYDSAGRALTKQQTVASILKATITRDALGRVLSLTYPSGMRVDVTYTGDVVSALAVNGVALLNNITYRPFTQSPSGWKWGNGTTYSRTFDADGRVTGVSLGTVQRSYGYDAAGRLTSQTDQTPAGPKASSYTYDEANQLSGYSGPGVTQGYAYDNNTNRRSWVNNGVTNLYTYATGTNRLLTSPGRSYQYNADGSPSTDGSFNFSYDIYGRMVRALWANNTDSSFRYNAFGQRVSKLVKLYNSGTLSVVNPPTSQTAKATAPSPTTSGTATTAAISTTTAVITWNTIDNRQFFYDDAGQLLGEYVNLAPGYASAAAPAQETIWFNGWPVAAFSAGVLYYVNPDHLGTPRSVVRASDNVEVWRWDSDPFGATGQSGAFIYNLRFPGQYYDNETGTHQNWMRDYFPYTGRYLQADPIGLGGGMNRYGYVGGRPLEKLDPKGLAEICTYPGFLGGKKQWPHQFTCVGSKCMGFGPSDETKFPMLFSQGDYDDDSDYKNKSYCVTIPSCDNDKLNVCMSQCEGLPFYNFAVSNCAVSAQKCTASCVVKSCSK